MAAARPRVAIVDDDSSVRKALSRLLHASDLDAEVFESGRAFLDSLAERRPDCLVLDLHMPDMNGHDVQRRLAGFLRYIPVIVITGHDESGGRDRCLAAGAAAYLSKPLDDRTLLAAIHDAIGQSAPAAP